jgi:hypothetical protein
VAALRLALVVAGYLLFAAAYFTGQQPPHYMVPKSGNCIAPVSANPKRSPGTDLALSGNTILSVDKSLCLREISNLRFRSVRPTKLRYGVLQG